MAKLIQFPRRRVEPPGTPLTPQQREELRQEDRRRMMQNIAALVLVLVLIWLGYWVIDRVAAYSRNVTCLHSLHKICR